MITSGKSQPATVWSTKSSGAEEHRLDRIGSLAAPLRGANAVGDWLKSSVVTFGGPDGASAFTVVSPGIVSPIGRLADTADTAAPTPDGNNAVVVAGTTGTVYDLAIDATAIATLSYPLPTTALAFAPRGTVLIAGHRDGSATVHTIDLSQQHASERRLNSAASSPVDALAVTANAAVAVSVHEDGSMPVWAGGDNAAVVRSAAAAGPHRAWLSADGDFAIVSDAAGRARKRVESLREGPTVMIAIDHKSRS